MNRRTLLTAAAAMALTACAGPEVRDYAKEEPRFDLRSFFNGPLTAKGMFTDRAGRVVKRFSVQMVARWDGDAGVLDERFQYSDGTTQRRVWRLRATGQGRYVGTADDVVGEAAGESAGNAFRWAYTLALPVDGRVWDVALDDWMFLLDERTVLNRSSMSKFGLHVGDVTLVITKD
ncbi:DUF3833 domain-containing protein [Roseateles sp. NT4]|uniref:DUF3833 domain-containing protein n=1 Tax=Roseateles sp. NT4 TaxID=3453715 RepID=UPI003EECD258